MRLNFSAEITDLLDLIRSQMRADQDLYIVGGALRDALLGHELHDLDFVSELDGLLTFWLLCCQIDQVCIMIIIFLYLKNHICNC